MAWQNPESLKLKVIDSKLRQEAVLADVFTGMSGIYNEKSKSIPDAIAAKVSSKSGEFERTVAIRLALIGAGTSGRDQIVGTEEELRTRQLSLRANTYGNAVPTITWGIDAEINKSVGILQEVQPALSQWHKEVVGFKIRESLAQLYSAEQLKSPASRNQGINPNVCVTTSTGATRVLFPGTTVAAFTANIAAAVPDSAGASDISSSNFGGIDTLAALGELAKLYMALEPTSIEGDGKLILSMPTPYFNKLFGSDAKSWAQLVKFDATNGSPTIFKGYEYGEFIIVNDARFPVLNVSNAGALTWYYKTPGGADARFASKTANTTDCAVGFILGKAAYWEFESSALAFKDNMEDYGRNVGVGAFVTKGYTAGIYSNDLSATATGLVDGSGNYASGIHAKSSAMVLFPMKTY